MQAESGSPPPSPNDEFFCHHSDDDDGSDDGLPSVNQSNEQKQEDIGIHLAGMVCHERVSPLSLCHEHGAFWRYVRSINPNRTSSLNLESLQHDCLKIYGEQQDKVKEIFSKLDGRVSLSFDVRMYDNQETMMEFICLAAHFIDNDWKLQHWVITYCTRIPRHPTKVTFNSMKKWGIEDKIFALTVGGTIDSSTVNLLKEGIHKRWEVPMNDHMFHWQISYCDIITAMVEEGFKENDKIMRKIELLCWSKSSPIWYLTSAKLRNALELEALGEFSSEKINRDYDVPTKEEWGWVKSICRITDRIYEIVKELFDHRKPTANLFLPHLQEVRAYLIQESASSDNFGKGLAQKMLTTFNEYWDHVYLVLSIAAFLDPRYKMKFIEFSFSKHEGDDGQSKASFILETIRKLYDGYLVQNHQNEYLLADSSSESEGEKDEEVGTPSQKKNKRECVNPHLDTLNILNKYCISVQANNDDQSHKIDLDLYLEDPILPWTEDFSVLLWWKDNWSKYPRLSKMALDFLAIPFSVAYSSEAYYTEPREADRTVLGLKSELMNALMCMRSWKLDYITH